MEGEERENEAAADHSVVVAESAERGPPPLVGAPVLDWGKFPSSRDERIEKKTRRIDSKPRRQDDTEEREGALFPADKRARRWPALARGDDDGVRL